MPDEYRYPHSLLSLPVVSDGAASAAPHGASPDQATSTLIPSLANDSVTADSTTTAAPAHDPARHIELKLIEGKVIEALREIFDPEIPVNIYELGLIYKIDVEPDHTVHIKMTLTAPACPVAGSLPGEVETRVQAVPEVKSADVELVWEPPWSRDLMSEAALLTLGML
ncbi:MAG TPA: SUF system Fe-S cluster assembly protein [Tepidisphaeraceae bacterium]|nr:SUF system Fe-S cluster assembly protein [Tepidisphaeraceae bacterium]